MRHEHVNLGLAIDLQKDDGTRTLLVPNIKQRRHARLRGVPRRVRGARSARRARTSSRVDDFAGTTVSITNPGTIGTMHSVPRLMPGQGVIVGVGAITYPPEYEGADPQTLAEIGVSKVVTLTSTYDHRIIQGAESGEFLGHDARAAARRATTSTTRSSRASACRTSPPRWAATTSRSKARSRPSRRRIAVQRLINMYRVRGHLIANLDPLGLKEPQHARGARPDPLGPHDLGPRPRVPDRRRSPASA